MGRPLTHLLDLQHVVRAELRAALVNLDLTPVQNTVLHLVEGTPGISSAELARRTHVTPQTMHRLVTDLERRELLVLRPRPGHGRIRDAELTDAGRTLLAQADSLADALDDRMTADLDDQQRRHLADLLRQCVTTLDGS
jgi:DNA-binding MarR family transcriptional regulator